MKKNGVGIKYLRPLDALYTWVESSLIRCGTNAIRYIIDYLMSGALVRECQSLHVSSATHFNSVSRGNWIIETEILRLENEWRGNFFQFGGNTPDISQCGSWKRGYRVGKYIGLWINILVIIKYIGYTLNYFSCWLYATYFSPFGLFTDAKETKIYITT